MNKSWSGVVRVKVVRMIKEETALTLESMASVGKLQDIRAEWGRGAQEG